MANDRIKPVRCVLDVRKIPLERFRLPQDKKRWRQSARARRAILLELATYANPDGFLGKWSPSIRTLSENYAESSLRRHMDALRELELLIWERPNHHFRRQYRILFPEPEVTSIAEIKTPLTVGENTAHS